MIKPLFKWAGGKKKMIRKYEDEVFKPKDIRCETFVDMFAGAGLMSMWAYENRERLGLKRIIFNDLNDELMHMFRMMREDVGEFIHSCQQREKEYFLAGEEVAKRKEVYLSWRTEYADTPVEGMAKATLLFCMLKTNFNGIWQSRARDGVYYTPFGNGKEVNNFIDPVHIRQFAEMLEFSILTCTSFEETDQPVREFGFEEAFFYADPPYLASFTKYKKKAGELNFGPIETEQLVEFLHEQAGRGASFALSNKQHEFFDKFDEDTITVFRNIKYTASAKDTERATSDEILWTNL